MARNRQFYVDRYGREAGAFIFAFKKTHYGALPWTAAYTNILARCAGYSRRDQRSYWARGFRCEVTPKQLREAFFRDKGWLIKQPSVDRKNPDASYTPDNIKWIPFSENRRMRKMNHPARQQAYHNIATVLRDQFNRLRWPYYLQIAFINRYRKELAAAELAQGRRIQRPHCA